MLEAPPFSIVVQKNYTISKMRLEANQKSYTWSKRNHSYIVNNSCRDEQIS